MKMIIIGIGILLVSFSSFGQSKINLKLKKELDSILFEDQHLRTLISSQLLQTKTDSLANVFKVKKSGLVPYIIKQIPISDSLNLLRVEEIIKQYGYPGLSMVGPETNEAAYYVIQHSTKIDKYLPLIKKATEKKEIEFTLYAMMLDRSLVYKLQEQIYGTQGKGFEVFNETTGQKEFKRIIWPIENANKVNQLRRKAGFTSTVEENSKRLGIDYVPYTLEQVKKMQENGIIKIKPDYNKLKITIDSLFQIDQKVQKEAIESFQRSKSIDTFKIYEKREFQTFERHIPLLKKIIAQYGYPTYEKVGNESSQNFFALVQHSDIDVEFQINMLPLIKTQVEKNQLKGSNYSMLYDRIQINSGKPQLYGSQVTYDEIGNAIPKELEDRKNVNKRRAEFGMSSIEDYLKIMTELHKKQNEKK